MSVKNVRDSIKEKKQDADELIREVIKKVPENRKLELLAVINGFILGADVDKKTN